MQDDKAKFRFQDVRVGSVETDPTQWDQFNTDELGAAEAVVRESHQNTLDAPAGGGPVRTRISVHSAAKESGDLFEEIFQPLVPHLKACGARFVPPDIRRPRFLVVEDFNTTGLVGSWKSVDDGNFSDFWRRFGNSHKSGSQGGSWGLGKLAYPATSVSRTFFGVTVREGDAQALLMGQTVLKHHEIGTDRFVPFGFYSTLGQDGLQLPITEAAQIERFSQAVGFRRTNEPGLSIAVPFVPDELTEESLIPPLLKNYFFPILMGKLEIEVGGVTLTKDTFDEVVSLYGDEDFSDGALPSFIRSLHEVLQANAPDVTFPGTWQYSKLENALDDGSLKALQTKLAAGGLVHVRVPIEVRTNDQSRQKGQLDLAYRLGKEGQKPRGLFVRNAITINTEAKREYRDKMAFAALVAGEGTAAQLLRASENPAHTEWNPKAQKLADAWDAEDAAKRVRQIKRLPRQLCDLLVQAAEQKDDNALIDFFSIPDASKEVKKRITPISPNPNPPPPTPKAFAVQRRATGFAVIGKDVEDLPQLRVTAAYDLFSGNPFKSFSPFDFDFLKPGYRGITIEGSGVEIEVLGPNTLMITPKEKQYHLEVTGFDINRDIRVDVRRMGT